MARAVIDHDFTSSQARVFAHLAEHENLGALFGARITRVRDGGDGSRDGVGSTRRLKLGPLPAFEETVTEFRPDELIRYRISSGPVTWLVTDHEGVMRFSDAPSGGTHLHYEIRVGARIPGLAAVVARVLQRRIAAGLPAADAASAT